MMSTAQISQPKKYMEPDELFDISLEEMLNVGIVSASKNKQGVQDAPATAYVFTSEDLMVRGYTNLSELLEDVPEVEFQRNASPQFRNNITVRGISGNEKLLILMNGIRITPATGDGYALSTNLSLTGAQRVEVIIGPASALYGVDAFAGIVNIITNENQEEEFVSASTEYGSFNTFNHNLHARVQKDNLSISLTGNLYSSAEPNYAEEFPEEYKWYNENRSNLPYIVPESPYYNELYDINDFQVGAGESFHGGPLSLDFNMPSRSHFIQTEVNFKNFTLGIVNHQDEHSTSYGVDPRYTLYEEDGQVKTTNNIIYAKHQFTSFNQKWGIGSTITLSRYELDEGSHFVNASSRWQRGYFYSQAQSSKIEEQFNYNFSSKLSVIAGLSYELLNSLPQTGLSPTPFDPEQPAPLQNYYYIGAAGYYGIYDLNDVTFYDDLTVKQNFYYIQYHNIGTYAQMLYQPSKNLSVTAGIRYDYNSRFKAALNPRLGIVYSSSNKKHRAKLLYGESFLSPSPYKSFVQGGSFYAYDPNEDIRSADYFRVPNPDLNPEKLRSLEMSYQIYLLKNLSLTLSGYYNYLTDLIDLNGDSDFNELTYNIDAARLETSVNQGEAEVYGLTARLNSLMRLGPITIKGQASYSVNDGWISSQYDFFDEDQPILNYSQYQYKGFLDIIYNKFYTSIKINGRGPSLSPMVDKVSYEYFESPAYTIANASLGYQIIDSKSINFRVYSRIFNLTNTTYYHNYVGRDDGMPYVPQDPIRFHIGTELTWKF
ncbi:TonB-dependent receptor plug domain-containing protein [Reichenbachiella ulvae]|uniref:TonB-dependent receptor n=1 Tax=Reichenbachiella ulvae TaxID=2980104 RepID=A0ABT3CQC4_9BACT|nr:TonB-dependent receptor [Reichenbachiella ulvae]MCV9385771.1 TonB-dependent receptor [Reichenbachiella ulvae]